MKTIVSLLGAWGLCCVGSVHADCVITFNELMYHPPSSEADLEWVELHNPMAVDIDLSRWSLAGGIQFTFAEGTIIPAGGHLVIASNPSALATNGFAGALGPFTGRLANNSDRLELRNNSGRLMDEVTYRDDGDWPVAPDDSGASLAKRDPQSVSDAGENWTSSVRVGGTPGRRNFPDAAAPTRVRPLIAPDDGWRVETNGTFFGSSWAAPDFDDRAWMGVTSGATLLSYWRFDGNATATVGTDGSLNGSPSAAADRNGQPNGALAFNGAQQQHVLVPGGGGLNGRSAGTISLWVKWEGTQDADCCSTFGAILARQANGQFSDDIIALNNASPSAGRVVWKQSGAGAALLTSTNAVGTNWHHLAIAFSTTGSVMYLDGRQHARATGPPLNNNAGTPLSIGAWTGDGGGFSSATLDDVAIWDQPLSAAQIAELAAQTKSPLDFARPVGFAPYVAGAPQWSGGLPGRFTALPLGPVTYYFRKTVVFDDDPVLTRLTLESVVDDGAIFYLNGAEVRRVNMAGGAADFDTPAASAVNGVALVSSNQISAASLVRGTNVFAVEVHQANPGADTDMAFTASLTATTVPPDPSEFLPAGILFNEIAAASASAFQVELINVSTNTLNLGGFVIARSGTPSISVSLPPQTLAPGGIATFNQTQLGFTARSGDRLYLYEPGSTRVADALTVRATARGRSPDGTGPWLFPGATTFGASNQVTLNTDIVINEIMYHPPPQYAEPAIFQTTTNVPVTGTWRFDQSGADQGTAWRAREFDDSAWASGPALFYNTADPLPAPKNTLLTLGPTTFYFRTSFVVSNNAATAQLSLRHIMDDGVIFYVNGVEVLRQNIPLGPVSFTNVAGTSVGTAVFRGPFTLSASNLVLGTNILAAEVHQAVVSGDDVVFGAELAVRSEGIPAKPFEESTETWLELHNRSTNAVNLTGWRLDEGLDYRFPSNTVIAPQGYLVVAHDPAAMRAKYGGISVVGPFTNSLSRQGERIVLKDANNNPADEIHYFDDGRWPEAADGGGASLELRDPRADNSAAEAWAASDETRRSEWRSYSYRGIASASAVGPDGQWHEFVFGLLRSGEILLDDISVIEAPAGPTPVQMIVNGNFDVGTNRWRIIGNHHGEVIDDPDQPGNKVLRVVATGGTEHMSNHGETTFLNNRDVVNTREYQISFRAKWIAGSPQLHTRLYFNRLPRTTILALPSQHGTPGAPNSTLTTNLGPVYRGFGHSPVVPPANAPVTVTVQASDPDGVSDLTLWWSVNGGAWSNAPMARGESRFAYHQFTGTIPGQPAAAIVQFYVEGSDTLSTRSTFPARGPNSRALYKVEDGLAAVNGLHNMRLVLTPDDATKLHRTVNLMSNDRLGCTMIYDERDAFYDVGARLKGSEHSRTTTPRLGFDVELTSEKRFRGVHRRLGIDRSESVGFGQREMLVHQMINHAGNMVSKYSDLIQVIPPRLDHTGTAELQMARYFDDFLDSQFPNGSEGMEFEYELVYQLNSTDGGPEGNKIPNPDSVVGSAITNLGDDQERYRWTLLIKNNEDRDDYGRIIPFAKAMGTVGTNFTSQIARFIDVDQWLRAFAVSVLSGCGDNYGADGAQHNLILYARPSDGRVLHFPHDLDAFFDTGRPLVNNPDLTKLVAVPVWARSYYRQVQEILDSTWNVNYMRRWAEHYGRLLPAQPFAAHLTFIQQRAQTVQTQLRTAAPLVPFSITTSNGVDFLTTNSSVVIGGNAWHNVADIRLANTGVSLPLTWTTVSRWQTTLPVILGTNRFEFVAYDAAGRVLSNGVITVTSTSATGGIDADRDGLPDVWETAFGLNPFIDDASADPDRDGLTSREEYLAGTDPRDRASALKVTRVRLETNILELAFTAVAGRSYAVQATEDLSQPNWTTVTNVAPAQATRSVVVTDSPVGSSRRTYRLRTPVP